MTTKRFEINGYKCAVRSAKVKCRMFYGVTSVAVVDGAMAISVRPDRAVKLAMNRAARLTLDRPRMCAVCNRDMGDDIECYRRDCDDHVMAIINLVADHD